MKRKTAKHKARFRLRSIRPSVRRIASWGLGFRSLPPPAGCMQQNAWRISVEVWRLKKKSARARREGPFRAVWCCCMCRAGASGSPVSIRVRPASRLFVLCIFLSRRRRRLEARNERIDQVAWSSCDAVGGRSSWKERETVASASKERRAPRFPEPSASGRRRGRRGERGRQTVARRGRTAAVALGFFVN